MNKPLKLIDFALAYAKRGIPIFPVSPLTKKPITAREKDNEGNPVAGTGGFKKATADIDQVRKWWTKHPGAMIGMPTGKASGIDVYDIDCKRVLEDNEIVDGFDALLNWEELSAVKVRTPSGGAHLYFKTQGKLTSTANVFAPGVDTRGEGGYVLLPPSRDSKGRSYAYIDCSPANFSELKPVPEELRIRKPKAHREIVEIDPGVHSAEEIKNFLDHIDVESYRGNGPWFTLLAAVNHASGGSAKEEFIAWSTSDPMYANDAEQIEARWNSLSSDHPQPITARTLYRALRDAGHPELIPASHAADDFVDLEAEQPRQIVEYDSTRPDLMAKELDRIIREAGQPIFRRKDRMVTIRRIDQLDNTDSESESETDVDLCIDPSGIKRPKGALVITEVEPEWLKHKLTTLADFQIPHPKRWLESKSVAIPMTLIYEYIATISDRQLRILNGVVETPTLRANGTLLQESGYDTKSRLVFDPRNISFPEIAKHPSDSEQRKSLDKLKRIFADFPFVDGASRSVALAMILTAVSRKALPSAPAFGVTAPSPGTGKTLLSDIPSIILTGHRSPVMSWDQDDKENSKRLFSTLIQGDQLIVIDNVERDFESAELCAILTAAEWKSRVLGVTEMRDVSTQTLFVITGNHLTFAGDMTTRALLCSMDAKMEAPEERDGFAISDLRVEVERTRVELITAALTILRGFIAAGFPGHDLLTQYGRFESWSKLVRGALVYLGEDDPYETRERIDRHIDVRDAVEELLDAWEATIGFDAEVTAKAVIETADNGFDPKSEALRHAVRSCGEGTPHSLGRYLASKTDIRFGDRFIHRIPRPKKADLFILKRG